MTSRERLLCAMKGGTPDRIPVAPFGLGHVDPGSSLACELIARTDLLLDVGVPGNPFLGGAASVITNTTDDITTLTIETPSGPLTRRVRRTEITSATIEFPFKSFQDVDRFLSVAWSPPAVDLAGYRGWEQRIGHEGLVMVGLGNAVCLAAEWFSPEGFCLAWAENPGRVIDLTAIAAERLNRHVEALCRAGVGAFRIVGGEYVSVQLGPRAFQQLVLPFDAELIATIHRHGALAYYHNHGRITSYLPALAALGMDALDPLEAPPWGDVDLRQARRIVGDRLCLVGNLDDMEVLETEPVDQILKIARARIDAAGDRAFVLGGTASGTYTARGAHAFLALAEMCAAL